MDRWRKPIKPLAVKNEETHATADLGRATLEYSARFSEDDIERFKLGYACLRCWEPLETAMPESCPLCGYRVKKEQPSDFKRLFQGFERDPRAIRIERELDKLDDKHEKRFWVPKPGIIVPRGE